MPGDPAIPVPNRSGGRTFILLTAGLCAAALLRWWNIAERPVWLDEAFSAFYARLDWASIIELRRGGTNPPLYHFLLSYWVDLFGDSPLALRLPSALLGVASVWLIYRLTRRVLGVPVAVTAAVLLAISNLAVCYAQEARFYAMTECLALAGSWALAALLDPAVEKGSGASCLKGPQGAAHKRLLPPFLPAVVYTLTMVTLVWVHTFAWFVLAAQVIWMVAAVLHGCPILRRRRRVGDGVVGPIGPPPLLREDGAPPDPLLRRRLAWCCAGCVVAIVVSFVPWVPILLDQVRGVRQGYWIGRPGYVQLAETAEAFVAVMPVLCWAAVTAAAGVVVISRARPNVIRSVPPPGLRVYLIAWMVLPVAVPFFWSRVAVPIYQIKYAIVAQPAALILIAWALQRRPRLVAAALAVVWACSPLWPGQPPRVEQWPEVVSLLRRHAEPGDVVHVYRDEAFFALDYYLRGSMVIAPVCDGDGPVTGFAPYYPRPPVQLDRLLEQLEAGHGDTWLTLRVYGRRRSTLLERLREAAPNARHWELRNVDLVFVPGGEGGRVQVPHPSP